MAERMLQPKPLERNRKYKQIQLIFGLACFLLKTDAKATEEKREIFEPPVFDALLQNVKNISSVDPEWNMTTAEMIRYHRYSVEEHDIVTEDGYILSVQRIPHGKKNDNGRRRNPIIVQSGLFAASSSWVFNLPEKNLPYQLADAGYDVWLTNSRGSTYGKKHIRLSADHDDFWQFSFHEMGVYDMPAIIDFIIKTTGSKQVDYIGHSMGTTIFSIMSSTRPEYNNKVRLAVLMAPLLGLQYMIAPFATQMISYQKYLVPILRMTWGSEFKINSKSFRTILIGACGFSTMRTHCVQFINNSIGFHHGHHNMTRFPLYLSHFPDSTSLQTLLHYFQLTSGPFKRYDYGITSNYIFYGQANPPKYNLDQITTPIALFWSDTDAHSNPLTVANFVQQVPSVVYDYRVPCSEFSHTDFVIADDATELVYQKVIETLENPAISVPTDKKLHIGQ